MLKKKLLSALQYIVLLAIGIALLVLAFKDINLSSMLKQIEHANYFWVSISVICSLAAYVSRAMRWNMLIVPTGYNPKLKNTLTALLAGYLANLAVPRMGEVTRCGALSQTEKIPFNVLIGTVIVERALDLLMLILSITIAICLQYNLVAGFMNQYILLPLQAKIIAILNSTLLLFIFALIVAIICSSAYWLIKNKHKFPIFIKLNNILIGVWQGIKSISKMENNVLFVFHTIFIWVLYFFMSYTCFFAIPATENLSVSAGVLTLVMGGLGMTAPVQGGIGVYHLFVSKGLTLYGVPEADGLVYATIVHTMQTILILLIGGISLFVVFWEKKKVAKF